MSAGIEKAWEILSGLNPDEVSKNASVAYDRENPAYMLKSLGMEFSVSPAKKEIRGLGPEAESLRRRLGYFFDHSALWYLIGSKDIPPSGRLVKPSDVKGGHHFFTGTHALPLDGIAGKYARDREGFFKKALLLGGRPLDYGDASAELRPMPGIPVTLILWLEDEEFPARADLLLDSTVEIHLPLDIIWSVSMLSALAMLG